MKLFWLATIFEFLILFCGDLVYEWEYYALHAEIRQMLWLFVAFALSTRVELIYRTIILFFSIWQFWISFVYSLQLFGIYIEFTQWYRLPVCLMCVIWFVFRSYDSNENSIPATKLNDGLDGNIYIIVKRPNKNNIFDILISMIGLPVRAISIYASGYVYGMDKESDCFIKRPISEIHGLSNRYAIKLSVDLYKSCRIIETLNWMQGVRFSWITSNCTSSLIPLCRLAGLTMPRIFYYFPGLFLIGIRKHTERRTA